jgi:hypothetical protein
MDLNEIKKVLYKSNPVASLERIRKGMAYYKCAVLDSSEDGTSYITVDFWVPVVDMGDADFLPEMDAKLLIRYIVI